MKPEKWCPRCGLRAAGCPCWRPEDPAEKPSAPCCYAVYKLTAVGFTLWWIGGSLAAAQAEFALCRRYGGGAKLRAVGTWAQYVGGR